MEDDIAWRPVKRVSSEQQLKWMTEPEGPDADYYLLLINERIKAIQETSTENLKLKKEIAELKEEQAVIDPLFEKMLEIKQLLLS